MRQKLLSDPHLHRYWFPLSSFTGLGVTAYSIEDAWRLTRNVDWPDDALSHIKEIVEDIDINALHFGHICGNLEVPYFRTLPNARTRSS